MELESDIGTDERVADLLLGCLRKNENVNTLQVRSVALSEGFVMFLRSGRHRPLTLEISRCSIDPQMLEVICSAFRESSIKSLEISDSPYSSDRGEGMLAPGLLEASRNHRSLQGLTIWQRSASWNTLIGRVVRESPRLHHLSLLKNNHRHMCIPKERFDDLGLSRITRLEFTDIWFSAQAVDAGTHYLRTNVHLTELAIRSCKFRSKESLGVLLSALHSSQGSNTRLRKLDLVNFTRSVFPRIPRLVRDLLLQNHTIESLTLDAKLENASLLPLAEGIRCNDSLK